MPRDPLLAVHLPGAGAAASGGTGARRMQLGTPRLCTGCIGLGIRSDKGENAFIQNTTTKCLRHLLKITTLGPLAAGCGLLLWPLGFGHGQPPTGGASSGLLCRQLRQPAGELCVDQLWGVVVRAVAAAGGAGRGARW